MLANYYIQNVKKYKQTILSSDNIYANISSGILLEFLRKYKTQKQNPLIKLLYQIQIINN